MTVARCTAAGHRVLAVVGTAKPTTRFARMITWFETLGFDIELLLWARQPGDVPSGHLGQLPRRVLLMGGGYGSTKVAAYYPVWWRRVSHYLAASDADLIYAYDFESAYGCIRNVAHTHRVFIYDIADNFHLRHAFPSGIDTAIKAMEHRVLDAANIVLLPDDCRVTELEQPYRDKIAIVANAPRLSERPSTGHDLPGDELVVYWNGWLDRCRGRDQIMTAVASTPGVRLLVAGGADESLQSKLHELGKAVYLGQLSPGEALKWYAAADIVFTFYEPSSAINRLACSSKWYDAMLSGRAILVNSEVAASAGLVASGVAYSCPYDDVEQLKDLLRQMVADRQNLREMGRRGRELFDHQRSWDASEPQLRSKLCRAMTSEGSLS